MTLRLTVDRAAWRAHVDGVRDAVEHLVPVVKGNGYGFGRAALVAEASRWAHTLAVGTVHEAADVPGSLGTDVVCLTPALRVPGELGPHVVPTVARPVHVAGLASAARGRRVAVKLASSMRRYGALPHELAELVDAVGAAGAEVHSFVLHTPLSRPGPTEDAALAEARAWLAHLDPAVPLSVSHLAPAAFARLQDEHPRRRLALRLGTALWHGDKTALHLGADVIDTRPVRAGEPAGYRGVPVAADGTLVMVGAGSAHGVAPHLDGRSPLHFGRRRLVLHEPPHMHTTMALVERGAPTPEPGDVVDVQRPLITVSPDEVVWH